MLEKGWIRPSMSPYGAPLLFVCKKTGELWMCIDYQALNRQAKLDVFPIPRIADLTAWVVLVFSRRWTWRPLITKSTSSKAMSIAQLSLCHKAFTVRLPKEDTNTQGNG